MAMREESCKWCGTHLSVPPEAQDVSCPVCHNIHCLSKIIMSYAGQYYGHCSNFNKSLRNKVRRGTDKHHGNQPRLPCVPCVPPQMQTRKKAVLCGVTYKNHPQKLDASINNVRMMQQLLLNKLGFPTESILVLTEDEPDASRIPTKINIQRALRWLVQGCKSGDSMVFYYSGHASRVQDADGDELDGYDEALCPVDYKSAGKIVDDEINDIIVAPLPTGAKLHSVIDSCFSGTILDLPFLCRMNPVGYYIWEDHRIPQHAAYKDTSGGTAICISACDDYQNSGDTTAFTNNAIGALTYSFIQALQNARHLTYGRLLGDMRNKVREAQQKVGVNTTFASSTSQEPQLSSSEQFDIYIRPFAL